MKTTIDIPDGVLQEAMKHCGSATKREAILLALEEYNRRRRMARLAKKLGTFEKFMTRDELESLRKAGDRRGSHARWHVELDRSSAR